MKKALTTFVAASLVLGIFATGARGATIDAAAGCDGHESLNTLIVSARSHEVRYARGDVARVTVKVWRDADGARVGVEGADVAVSLHIGDGWPLVLWGVTDEDGSVSLERRIPRSADLGAVPAETYAELDRTDTECPDLRERGEERRTELFRIGFRR